MEVIKSEKSTISVLLTLLLASSTGCTILNDSQSSELKK